jgi:hypothetical protein
VTGGTAAPDGPFFQSLGTNGPVNWRTGSTPETAL